MAHAEPSATTQRPSSREDGGSSYDTQAPGATSIETSEVTPLLSQPGSGPPAAAHTRRSSAVSLLRSIQGEQKARRRWPSMIALIVLSSIALLIMVLGFLTPQTIREYAEQAAAFEPTSLTVAHFTKEGVQARVQGTFTMDSSRVTKTSVRKLGRFGTWIARQAGSGQATVELSLPELGNLVLGTAQVPPMVLNIVDGQKTAVDLVTDLQVGDREGVKRLAADFLAGRLGHLRVLGKAKVSVKSGLLSVGMQSIHKEFILGASDIPKLPKYTIRKVIFHDMEGPGPVRAVAADAQIIINNDYPVDIRLPSFALDVFAPNCRASQDPILLAHVTTESLHIEPKKAIKVDLAGVIRELDPAFSQTCPQKDISPMDALVRKYIHGEDVEVLVKAASEPSKDMPAWMSDLISDITVPIRVPGHESGELVKDFSLTNVHFGLPDTAAPDNSPESNPSISATIKARIVLPEQMNFDIRAREVRANANVFYKGRELGKLDLSKWQKARSKSLPPPQPDGRPGLLLESDIKKAPIIITDEDVFAKVVERMLLGNGPLILDIEASVDVRVETALGQITVRNVPAEGRVPIKTLDNGIGLERLKPRIWQLQILDTGRSSLIISALANFTNPTEYSATIPYANVRMSKNGSTLGHVTVRDTEIKPGQNVNVSIVAVWDPLGLGSEHGHEIGIELLSQYVSGFNTTITAQTFEGTIPASPNLGRALSRFPFEVPTPQLRVPPCTGEPQDGGEGDKDKACKSMRFIADATMHLISSSATFTLTSPLQSSTIYITHLNATALYKGDKVGHIDHDEVIAVPPVVPVTTPKIPVVWSLGSVGYGAIRNAVGGTLRLSAEAEVGIRIGLWEERIWYLGRGIGAHVRL